MARVTASTGPPLIGGGEGPRAVRGRRGPAASTGPPLIGGGEIGTEYMTARDDVMLQRVRR